jgi:hypothetical protein
MSITNAGNVGIGTSAPGEQLTINGPNAMIGIQNTAGGQLWRIVSDTDGGLKFVKTSGATFTPLAITGNGAIGVYDGIGATTFGTPGYVLTSSGAGAPPTWQPSSTGFTNNTEVPRGDGTGLVSSNINSDGANVSIGTTPVNGSKLYVKQLDGNPSNIGAYMDVAGGTSSNTGLHALVSGAGSTSNFGADLYSNGGNSTNALRATASGGLTSNMGVAGYGSGSTTNYGIYGFANGGATNYSIYGDEGTGGVTYAGYFNGKVHVSGNVGIGTTAPVAKLDVVGGDINTSGEINRAASGTSNMVPIAYGFVNSGGGLLSGTSNLNATNTGTGTYAVNVTSEAINSTNYVAVVTPSNGGGTPIVAMVQANGTSFIVSLKDVSGGGGGTFINNNFYIVIYKY